VSGRFVLLPNVRTALVDAATAPAPGSSRRALSLRVQVLANDTPVPEAIVSVPGVELKGASDVVGLDLAQIAVREPAAGSAGVEPNYFPYIELVDSDFPWRLSLDVGSGRRRRPWLVLIALTRDEFEDVEPPPGPLPVIRVASPAASLPPLAQAWAWAHVHIRRDEGASFDIDRALCERPETHVARILCPRRLRDSTAYTILLVPAFEAGRLRGLGQAGPVQPWDAAAWDSAATVPLDLPWYDRWTIATSTLEDIESMIRRLRPAPAVGAGASRLTRTVDASRPGYFVGFDDPGRTFEAEGALRTVDFEAGRAPYADTPLTAPLAARLTDALRDERVAADGPDREDPLVALPAWGGAHAGATEIASPSASPARGVAWVNEANLDLRNRLAAGAGARVVRRHQDDFMRQAWEQVGELQQANALRARLQLAERLALRLVEKHFLPLAPETALSLAEPVLHITRPDPRAETVRSRLERAGLPTGYGTLALRRVAARRAVRRTTDPEPGSRAPLSIVVPQIMARDDRPRSRGLASAESVAAWSKRMFPALEGAARAGLVPDAAPPTLRAALGTIDVTQLRATVAQKLRRLPLERARAEILGLSAEESGDLAPVRRTPRLVEPLSTFLAREEPELFLPGAGALPYDSIVLLEENPRFVESFLAGANEELRRELIYREYPFEPRASVFTRFWDRGAEAGAVADDDVPPLDRWQASLGDNASTGTEPRLVILVRGELARRFPGFMVALNRQVVGTGGWSPTAGTTSDPLFWGALGQDTRFFGFAIGASQVGTHAGEYFLVIYEPPGRLRFGLDIQTWSRRMERRSFTRASVPFGLQTSSQQRFRGLDLARANAVLTLSDPAPIVAGPATWNDLSWDHVQLTSGGYVDFDVQMTISSDPSDGAWGPQRTSASLARTLFQHPVRVVVPARMFF
jgi:hypothetical protein